MSIIERLINERSELRDRLDKLNLFIVSPSFDELDQENRWLLRQQELVMQAYESILTRRINVVAPLPK